ncbi:MAG TPA: hypothetical protein PLG25_12680 [bacterium]|nr:hypothetical protein [bacterium]HNM13644.1 hypothetical protein [bacterium]HNO12352.1 hypothetical protein [bacterium]
MSDEEQNVPSPFQSWRGWYGLTVMMLVVYIFIFYIIRIAYQ